MVTNPKSIKQGGVLLSVMYDDIPLNFDGSDTASKSGYAGFEVAAKFDMSVCPHPCVGAQADGKWEDIGYRRRRFSRNNHPKCRNKGARFRCRCPVGRPDGSHRRFLRMLTSRDRSTGARNAKGRTGLRKFILGSVATSVVREATQPCSPSARTSRTFDQRFTRF